jgi:predicted TIM-barrel fold metal-dependent hydrolase
MGLRGGVLDVRNAYRPLWHPDWDPLWATAQDLEQPISFHAAGKVQPGAAGSSLAALMARPEGTALVEGAIRMTLLQFDTAADYFGIIFGGALDRHPRLQVVFGESGIGWIPAVLERMDWQYDNEFSGIGLQLPPSEYWHRQLHATFQWDAAGLAQLERLGADHVLYASDYPHPDGTWPDSRQIVARDMAGLSDADRHQVLYGNAARLYKV